jgi:hypothetical protein
MIEYRYALIRFVPDMRRMEPINVGVIVQGPGRIDLKLSPHAAKRKDVETGIYQQWRDFLTEEISGAPRPLFQPRKTSPDFIRYVSELCEGPVVVSNSLAHQAPDTDTFEAVLEKLYQRLVAPMPPVQQAETSRPAGRFRQLSDAKAFVQRGMKRHQHVTLGQRRLWMPYRQVENGRHLAVDKIEVHNQIGSTANEIERIPHILAVLPEFLHTKRKQAVYVLLADELGHPFSDQSDEEFRAMRDDLERAVSDIQKAGARVLRSAAQVEELADEVDEMLPALRASEIAN